MPTNFLVRSMIPALADAKYLLCLQLSQALWHVWKLVPLLLDGYSWVEQVKTGFQTQFFTDFSLAINSTMKLGQKSFNQTRNTFSYDGRTQVCSTHTECDRRRYERRFFPMIYQFSQFRFEFFSPVLSILFFITVGRDANLPCVVEHLGTYKVSVKSAEKNPKQIYGWNGLLPIFNFGSHEAFEIPSSLHFWGALCVTNWLKLRGKFMACLMAKK